MNGLTQFDHPAWSVVALVLIHFAWQATVIGMLWRVAMAWPSSNDCWWRYRISLLALIALVAAPVATSAWIVSNAPEAMSPLVDSSAATSALVQPDQSNAAIERESPANDDARTVAILNQSVASDGLAGWLLPRQRWLLLAWLCGATILALRLTLSAGACWRLRINREQISAETAAGFAPCADRLGMPAWRRLVFVSERVTEAVAVGVVRPIVLVPASWFGQMSPEVLYAILAHELAHIRRHDLLVNLVQRVVEMVFFFHPFVWWLSAVLRYERERCCDQVAVAVTGDRVVYARALAEAAALRLRPIQTGLVASILGGKKMALLRRVRSVLDTTPNRRRSPWGSLVGLCVLASVASWTTLTVFGTQDDDRRGSDRERVDRQQRDVERTREPQRRERGDETRDRVERRRVQDDRFRDDRRDPHVRERSDASDRDDQPRRVLRDQDRDRTSPPGTQPRRRDAEAEPRNRYRDDADPFGPRGNERRGDGNRPAFDDRRFPDGERRMSDRPNDPFSPGAPLRRRESVRGPFGNEFVPNRTRERVDRPREDELLQLIRDLHNEVRELRREVADLRRTVDVEPDRRGPRDMTPNRPANSFRLREESRPQPRREVQPDADPDTRRPERERDIPNLRRRGTDETRSDQRDQPPGNDDSAAPEDRFGN